MMSRQAAEMAEESMGKGKISQRVLRKYETGKGYKGVCRKVNKQEKRVCMKMMDERK